jgi:hypothetical protein
MDKSFKVNLEMIMLMDLVYFILVQVKKSKEYGNKIKKLHELHMFIAYILIFPY